MKLDPIALSIPFFFLAIGLELLVARWKGRSVYRLHDAITDLACGMTSIVSGAFTTVVVVLVYTLVHDRLALLPLSQDALSTWALAFVLLDHQYYWWHRASHRVNFLWAAHVVHHQSEDYNLAVALRQALFTGLTSLPFYLPLAVLGVPPLVFLIVQALNTLYQFWIHTRLVGRLGPIEWVMNTPSHHRVHHGINPGCIDRNHAGVYIIWDKLYGTFAPEPEEEPVYGTVSGLRSWNPIWANFHEWGKILRLSRSCTRLSDKLYAWIAPPEWRPAEQGGPVRIPEVDRSSVQPWDVEARWPARLYVLAWYIPAAMATTLLLVIQQTAPFIEIVVLGAFITATCLGWGALFENRRWGIPLEAARLLGLVLVTGLLIDQGRLPVWTAPVVGMVVLASALALRSLSRAPRIASSAPPIP